MPHQYSRWIGFLAIAFVGVGFALNSVITRAALSNDQSWGIEIGLVTFTIIRIISGAAILLIYMLLFRREWNFGSVRGGIWYVLYAFPYSLAFVNIAAGVGALIQFVTTQIIMLFYEQIPNRMRSKLPLWLLPKIGNIEPPLKKKAIAFITITIITLGLFLTIEGSKAGISTGAALLGMLFALVSGLAWGMYSLSMRDPRDSLGHERKKNPDADPFSANAMNFIWAAPFAAIIGVIALGLSPEEPPNLQGVGWAIVCGALTSGLACSTWYTLISWFSNQTAAVGQLGIPLIASLIAVYTLGETLTATQWALASITVIGLGLSIHSIRRQQ